MDQDLSWYRSFNLSKTVEINLRKHIKKHGPVVMDFNPWHQFDKKIKKRKNSERASAKMETNYKELLFLNKNTIASSYCFITILQTGNYPLVLSESRGIKLCDHLRKIFEIIATKGSHQEERIPAVMFFLAFFSKKRLETEWSRAGRTHNSNLAVLPFIMLMKHELSKRSRVFFSHYNEIFSLEKRSRAVTTLCWFLPRVFLTYYFHGYAKLI